jgi:serine/threonine protein kinase/tetratricopeptide (TPR) repeat protein
MNTERWLRVVDLFDRASELDAGERNTFLRGNCDDPGIIAEVESLLAYDHGEGGTFASGVRDAVTGTAAEMAQPRLEKIGPYRLTAEIGSGGMGAVYLGEREGDFEQRVAIKIVRGFMNAESLHRFRAERQILASLQHPNIARLLDGGATADGTPYLVMEYVDGVPIDRYCHDRGLSNAERVRLFQRVCDAVSYAHRSLVIHRDLKPSNILVTSDGTPKLLDFGIAKLIEPGSGDANTTQPSMRLMTPHYASPEQVRGEPITTAADIYGLGVLLYVLLSGKRPYQIDTTRTEDIERIVCHTEPPRPSTVDAADPRVRALRGDLDTIVMTAIEKDPARRFSSADAIALDLLRWLEGRPIKARPSTWAYRTRRFISRHRIGAGIAIVFVVTILGFGYALARSAAQARSERDAAERVMAMLIQMFSGSDPRTLRGNTITARELLDQGADQIRTRLKDQPDMQARLLDALGAIYVGLGLPDRAQTVLHDSMTARQSAGLADSQPAARTMWRLAGSLYERGQYTAAEPLARAAYEMTRRLVGPMNPQAGETLNTLAMILRETGRVDEAEQLFLEVIQIFRDTLGPEHPMVGMGLTNAARIRIRRGDATGAERMIREALVIQRRIFGNTTGESLGLLADILETQGKPAEALPLRQESLTARRAAFGSIPHPVLEQSLTELARTLTALGRPAEAAPLLQEAESIRAARAK